MQKQYSQFIFNEFNFSKETGELSLCYSLDNKISFTEKIIFPLETVNWQNVNTEVLDRLFFALHLACGVGYWKTYCPSQLIISSGKLDKDQAIFWNNIYTKGMGEFFYENKIDFRGLVNFPFSRKKQPEAISLKNLKGVLLPIGGGKDSITSAEILKTNNIDFTLFSVYRHEPIEQTARLLNKPKLTVDRKIDPKIIELNNEGAYNGHVPITAIVSLITLITAVLHGKKHVVFSLEKSANFGQLEYLGMEINHQYSKSEEFENLLNQYLHQYISKDIHYSSLLRPLHEIQIAKLFTNFLNDKSQELKKEFLLHTASCNKNFKVFKEKGKKLWCGECPKCVFVFSIFSPFFDEKELINTFDKNLFEDEKLIPLFKDTLGIGNHKPFECVGTPEETQLALALTYKQGKYKNSLISKIIEEQILPKINLEELEEKLLWEVDIKRLSNYLLN